jgi:hypothetical protein
MTATSAGARACFRAPVALGMLAALSLLSAPSTRIAAAQDAPAGGTSWTPARTPDGQPDLQGFWTAAVAGTYDLTDPRGGEIRLEEVAQAARGIVRRANPSRIIDPPDGKIPYQPWAAAKHDDLQAHADNPTRPEHIDTQNRCLPDGPLRDLLHGAFRIVQVPGYFMILGEENYGYRAVPLDGRPHLGQDVKLWMGDPRGHWEGTRLVIEVTNLNGKPRLDMVANFYSERARFIERFTPSGPDTFDYEVTVEDPGVYTRPWKLAARFRRAHSAGYEFFEDACHEGEQSADRMLIPAGTASKPDR